MTFQSFSINYDYRCPYARNLNEYAVEALRLGVPYEIKFVPFNLSQVHVEEGAPPIWDDPEMIPILMANEIGYIVSQLAPDRFLDVHLALFSLRHDEAKNLKDRDEVTKILVTQGVDASKVFDAFDSRRFSNLVRELHEDQVDRLQVFGVPTLFHGQTAAFVRIMERPSQSEKSVVSVLDRVIEQVFEHSELNEIKHTSLDR